MKIVMVAAPVRRLFSKGDVESLLKLRLGQIEGAIGALNRSDLAASDPTGTLLTAMVGRFRLETPALDLSTVTVDPAKRTDRGKRGGTVSVSFVGNPELFDFHPGWYPAYLPRGRVGRKRLQLIIPPVATKRFGQNAQSILAQVAAHLDAMRKRTDAFNRELRDLVTSAIRREAIELESATGQLAAAGYLVAERGHLNVPIRPGLRILVIATEWGSGHGGLSTLSRELCRALAVEGMKVVCVVLRCSREEEKSAAVEGVDLIQINRAHSSEQQALESPKLPEGFDPDVIIGHGRITGPAARLLKESRFPHSRRVHIVHMAPEEIEWFKLDRKDDAGQRAEERTKLELELARTADVVAAIGPRLHGRFSTDLHAIAGPKPVRLDPGFTALGCLPEVPAGEPRRVLIMGRAEDDSLKGLDIAARAVAFASRSHPKRIELVIRGSPQELCAELRSKLIDLSGDPSLDVVVKPYTSNAAILEEDINAASLVLMPSRTEGFGLVGLEAIERGVPVLVSDQSGLGDMLGEMLDAQTYLATVLPVTRDLEQDGPIWGDAILRKLASPKSSFQLAADIREVLVERKSWELSLKQLLEAL